jgi:NAD(P)H-quinone oxidoreductase subunit 5
MSPAAFAALTALLAPLLLGFVGSFLVGAHAITARRLTLAGAGLAFLSSLALAVALAWGGPASPVFAWLGDPATFSLSAGLQLDALSALMLVTVTLIGLVVSRYAARYLDGDPAQAVFSRWLAFTLSMVILLVVARNLGLMLLAWFASGLGLARLLRYSDKPRAVLAARKAYLLQRLGDALFAGAVIAVMAYHGTLELPELANRGVLGGSGGLLIAALLALAAMIRSVQLPFHSWLPDTMDTPTPVSALMHAGIVNGGGFLLIRCSKLFAASPVVMTVVALVGASTAVVAAVVMLSQTDIKRKLAYSTIAQMGFMMLQCGLGAFAVAALHIVGHSFYKAHAFLGSASTVDPEAEPGVPRQLVSMGNFVAALAVGLAVVGSFVLMIGIDVAAKPGLAVLGAVLVFAIAQQLLAAWQRGARTSELVSALRDGTLLVGAYLALSALFALALEGVIVTATPAVALPLSLLAIGLFGGALALQASLPRLREWPAFTALYVHAYNGFYFGALTDRLVRRLWPVRSTTTPYSSTPYSSTY